MRKNFILVEQPLKQAPNIPFLNKKTCYENSDIILSIFPTANSLKSYPSKLIFSTVYKQTSQDLKSFKSVYKIYKKLTSRHC